MVRSRQVNRESSTGGDGKSGERRRENNGASGWG